MIPCIYDLEITLNKKSKADVIYFDFAKVFNSVSHDIILQKLKLEYKIRKTNLGKQILNFMIICYTNKYVF